MRLNAGSCKSYCTPADGCWQPTYPATATHGALRRGETRAGPLPSEMVSVCAPLTCSLWAKGEDAKLVEVLHMHTKPLADAFGLFSGPWSWSKLF